MALNQKYTHNDHIALTADKDYQSGDPVAIGAYRGVAQTSAETGERVTVWLNGSYMLTVTGAAKEGDPIYLTSAGKLTTTAGDTFFGVSNGTKGSGDGDLEVAPAGIVAPAPAPAGA